MGRFYSEHAFQFSWRSAVWTRVCFSVDFSDTFLVPCPLSDVSGDSLFLPCGEQAKNSKQEVPSHRELYCHQLVPWVASAGPGVCEPPLPAEYKEHWGKRRKDSPWCPPHLRRPKVKVKVGGLIELWGTTFHVVKGWRDIFSLILYNLSLQWSSQLASSWPLSTQVSTRHPSLTWPTSSATTTRLPSPSWSSSDSTRACWTEMGRSSSPRWSGWRTGCWSCTAPQRR